MKTKTKTKTEIKTETKTISLAISASTALMIIILTAGCGGGKATKIITAPDYKKQFAINADVAVMAVDESPEIIYFGDIIKSLGKTKMRAADTTAEALAWNFFRNRLIIDLQKEIDVKAAFWVGPARDFRITREAVRTLDEDVTVDIPEAGIGFAFGDTVPALVLFLDKIRLGTETDPYYVDRAQGGFYTTSGRKLLYLASFVLWDNRERKYISYGRVKATVPITGEEATAANWEEVSRVFVRTMFGPTGFVKRGSK